jgi:hypothetical protein
MRLIDDVLEPLVARLTKKYGAFNDPRRKDDDMASYVDIVRPFPDRSLTVSSMAMASSLANGTDCSTSIEYSLGVYVPEALDSDKL